MSVEKIRFGFLSYSRSNRSGFLGKFWFSRSPIFALGNSRPLPGSCCRRWFTHCKFILERDQIRGMGVEEVRQFQGILLPQDSHNGGKNALDKVLSMVTGEFAILCWQYGRKMCRRFRLGW